MKGGPTYHCPVAGGTWLKANLDTSTTKKTNGIIMLLAKVRRRPDLDTCFISPSRFFSWDFLFGFLPTTSVSLFRDYLPAPLICKSIFKSALGFSLTRRVFRCPFCSQRSFSPGCEDTSSVVAVVFIKGMNNGILIVVSGGRRWLRCAKAPRATAPQSQPRAVQEIL